MNGSNVATNTDRDNDEILTALLPPPPPMSAASVQRRLDSIDRHVLSLLAERCKLVRPSRGGVVVSAPLFNHAELKQIWHAISQYVDNHGEYDDGDPDAGPPVPPEAEAVRDRLDAYFADAAEVSS